MPITRSFIVNAIQNEIEKQFDAGWKAFVDEIRAKNKLSNERLFKILTAIVSPSFVSDLKKFMKEIGREAALIHISKKPLGIELGDKRFKTIPKLWIDQKSTEDGMTGTICIQVKQNKWIKFSY